MRLLAIFFLVVVFNYSQATLCSLRKAPRKIIINPPTMFDPVPFGYSHIAVDTKNEIAYIAGQVALNRTGSIVGETLAEQLLETERNLNLALKAVDADINDIVKLNGYVSNFNPATDLSLFQQTGKRLGSPPSTVISTPSLALHGLLVEIEITVVVTTSFVRKIICKSV